MKQRLMIVEDERIVALDLKHNLEYLGYEVVAVSARGLDAIALAGELRPDLVLMDINLGEGMDGTEAAQEICDRYRIPVVFLTAYAEEKTLARAEATQPYGYLLKPFELRELEATIRMALARRQAELGTERAEARLRLAVDAATLGVWEWWPERDELHCYGHLEHILGIAPNHLHDDGLLALVNPADRGELARRLEQDDAVDTTVQAQRPDGTPLWLDLHAKFHHNDGGPRVIGVVRDVTERRLNEERLRQAAVVFQSTPQCIIVTDAARRVISVNPAFSELTGHSVDSVLGADPDEFLHLRRHSDQFYPRLLANPDGYWHGEIACRRADGTSFPAWEHVCVVLDDDKLPSNYILSFSDISPIREAEAQISQLAYHDALTGLGNRHQLDDRLEIEIERASLARHRLAVLFIDLDGFKLINDTLGHAVGDQLLQTVARRLKRVLRRTDIAIRMGGDEFVVIAAELSRLEDCAVLAEKLLDTIREPIELERQRLSVSASLGIAIYPENGTTTASLLAAADSAMYEAKARGRNRYAFYSPDMAEHARERMVMEQGLLQALTRQELLLHYQPVIALDHGHLIGVEALVRWQHPELGLVPPARFIPVAEDSGLIERIGAWVLRTACEQAQAWRDAGLPPLRMAVNVAVRQLMSDTFVDLVARTIEETGIDPASLELEITESAILSVEHSRDLLLRLKALGLSIAIDDFGTGFSSLSLLKHLPVDRIKIDRSFVMDLPQDQNDVAITHAIVALAKSMGLALTAEGIETVEQHAFLRQLQVEDGQGYLFSKPQPPDALQPLLERSGNGQTAG
ncbi:two-component system response regulator [Chitinolyticbacter meiyuanensis]|uniref:two-component system response regulator n=1 Tax=Chitinolyticbacter meiyuanensis TaxID=682798 RepID=UPI0011E5D959|nr:EAL domain-containing protein [Chitinolyticbacter meiyuanensis]